MNAIHFYQFLKFFLTFIFINENTFYILNNYNIQQQQRRFFNLYDLYLWKILFIIQILHFKSLIKSMANNWIKIGFKNSPVYQSFTQNDTVKKSLNNSFSGYIKFNKLNESVHLNTITPRHNYKKLNSFTKGISRIERRQSQTKTKNKDFLQNSLIEPLQYASKQLEYLANNHIPFNYYNSRNPEPKIFKIDNDNNKIQKFSILHPITLHKKLIDMKLLYKQLKNLVVDSFSKITQLAEFLNLKIKQLQQIQQIKQKQYQKVINESNQKIKELKQKLSTYQKIQFKKSLTLNLNRTIQQSSQITVLNLNSSCKQYPQKITAEQYQLKQEIKEVSSYNDPDIQNQIILLGHTFKNIKKYLDNKIIQ